MLDLEPLLPFLEPVLLPPVLATKARTPSEWVATARGPLMLLVIVLADPVDQDILAERLRDSGLRFGVWDDGDQIAR